MNITATTPSAKPSATTQNTHAELPQTYQLADHTKRVATFAYFIVPAVMLVFSPL